MTYDEMTYDEIARYVMGLLNIDVCRLTATDIMGCQIEIERNGIQWYRNLVDDFEIRVDRWYPDIFRDQSRMVTDKVGDKAMIALLLHQLMHMDKPGTFWWKMTPDQESRAALIAHYAGLVEAIDKH